MIAAPPVPPPPAQQLPAALRRAERRRVRRACLLLAAAAVALAWLTLTWGGHTMDLLNQLGAPLGLGDGSGAFTIVTLRLPRVVLSVLVGVAFALSGALFQTTLRNPLASPDILGISGGASLAAAFAILVLGLTGAPVSAFAFGGALAVAVAIYLLAWRDGVTGLRFVLIGVAVAFAVNAGIGYLITRGEVNDVRAALVWMVGSIGTPKWGPLAVLAVLVALGALAVAAATRPLRALQLGDHLAAGLGTRVAASRVTVLGLGVALAAVATAFAGPVAFVAFVSAPIARRMLPTAGLALLPAALVGVVVVLAAEFVAGNLLGALEVPVGIVTGLIGAPYLLWLLATNDRGGQPA